MNLLASYNWLKEYVDLKGITPEEFASRISLSGPGIERLYPQGEHLRQIVVGRVVEIKTHPNADKLKLALVDVGGKTLSIVCGGSNLAVDQWVAVAKIGAMVRWHGEGEPVELKSAEIRGIKSEGMICAANEIGLFDIFPHIEREILDLNKALPEAKLKAGMPLGDLLGVADDVVMDVEVTTNRPDAMSIAGLAREAAAILKRKFLWAGSLNIPLIRGSQSERVGALTGVSVRIADKTLCPRFMAVQIDGVKVGPSPWWLKRRLISSGVRPINNVVDITNYVMLEIGQPMHVYDSLQLTAYSSQPKLEVRIARVGEKMLALDGKEYQLDDTMLIVADERQPIDIVGVMGGEATGVTKDTTSILFEAATVDPVSIRRTARKLNLYSGAQALFEKGLSTEAPPLAIARAIELCLELAGGQVASKVFDSQTKKYQPKKFSIKTAEVNALIGVELPVKEMYDTLQRLGFSERVTSYELLSHTGAITISNPVAIWWKKSRACTGTRICRLCFPWDWPRVIEILNWCGKNARVTLPKAPDSPRCTRILLFQVNC
ncbi:MAG: phenylalanine--tRNA ligase subunit beta [Candidatus Uhrbacteria bacterium]|nr:phenylalanine--tRNA ligase subunit beta [Candidatus Uhrbacteria bacterium]